VVLFVSQYLAIQTFEVVTVIKEVRGSRKCGKAVVVEMVLITLK